MSFSIRSDRRFPICCPMTYHMRLREGHGHVWNLSVKGWRFSGDVPLRVGQPCPLTINVPDQPPPFVLAKAMRWIRGTIKHAKEQLATLAPEGGGDAIKKEGESLKVMSRA